MSESGSETVPKSSGTPEESRQSESTIQATPQLHGERSTNQSEPEPVPSTSGINSKGKKLVDPKSRFYRKKGDSWEDSIVSAFKFIKISGEWNEDDSSDDDFEEEQDKQKKTNKFDCKKDENAILELLIDPGGDTYPQVHDAEDNPGPSTSFNSALETGTPENEPEPVSEENFIEDAPAPAPGSPPPHPPRVSPLSGSVMSSMPFYNLRLPKETIRNLRDSLGITITTILQEKAIPILMQERDAFMHAAPGSGKTVAFTIPVIHHLLLIKPQVCREDGIRVLVVVPNKESAVKTYQIFTTVVRPAPWIVVGHAGGSDHFRTEKEMIRKGVIILITTPMRFLDHLRRTSDLFLKNVSCLVVDGLDEIIQKGDEKHLSDIITVLEKGLDYLHHPDYISTYKKEHVEASRQTILISSLVTQRVALFTGLNTTNPMMIDDRYNSPPRPISMPVGDSTEAKICLKPPPPPLTNQYFMIVPERMKWVALIGFVMWKCRVANQSRILVFAGTQTMADYFSDMFSLIYGKTDIEYGENSYEWAGLDVYKLNPFMSKNDKIDLFMTFSRSSSGILFCSDSAVRGIDLPEVDWVVHLHAPTCTSGYMARIGMANPGIQIGSSVTLLLPAEKTFVQELRNHDVPLTSIRVRQSFRHLWAFYPPTHTVDDMTFEIQSKIEEIVRESPCMHDRACLAFASWCRLYSSYPESFNNIFRLNYIQLDNYVYSFGLRVKAIYVINRAKKLHSDARRKHPKKRSAPAESEGSPQESSKKLLPPPTDSPAEARIPAQAAAPTGTKRKNMMSTRVKASRGPCAKGRAKIKKRKNDEKMELSGGDEECPGKRSK